MVFTHSPESGRDEVRVFAYSRILAPKRASLARKAHPNPHPEYGARGSSGIITSPLLALSFLSICFYTARCPLRHPHLRVAPDRASQWKKFPRGDRSDSKCERRIMRPVGDAMKKFGRSRSLTIAS